MHKERSYLEWKVNLPYMWIDAAARDEFSKENLISATIVRNDMKYKAVN